MIVASELYRGAASYYTRHVIPYSEDIFRSLVRLCRLGGSSRAVDLGAGTGMIGIRLAHSIAHVLSVDPCDEMLLEAERIARAAGVRNIQFVVSRSEDLNESKWSFDIATIASSFLHMDRETVLANLTQMLKPDGCVAIINRERDSSEPGEWHKAMLSDIKQFWGGNFPAGPGAVRPVLTASDRDVLRASHFNEVTELRHYYEHHWNIDDLLGYVYSGALGAPGVLESRREEFTTRIRRLLLSYSATGLFTERGHVTTLLGYRP